MPKLPKQKNTKPLNKKTDPISEILTRGVAEVIDRASLESKLRGAGAFSAAMSGAIHHSVTRLGKRKSGAVQSGSGKLRVKLGIDPTSNNIHIGRAVTLWKLRDFQDLGHKIIFIVGDFTGLVGDTSDKDSERPMLSKADVVRNMKGYLDQAGKILDLKAAETHYNSEWLARLDYLEIAAQADQFSLHEFEARENISRRMRAGKRVSLREVLYPLMQGYDSVAVRADLEVGGTDQRFNLLAGRVLQKYYGQAPQDIMTFELISGLDGRKMSSSWGNVINITDSAADIFGKTMSILDSMIIQYFVSCTRVPMTEIEEMRAEMSAGKLNPRHAKARLARELVRLYHGARAADAAERAFNSTFRDKQLPADMPSVKLAGHSLSEILIQGGLVKSNSEARRILAQGGVKISGNGDKGKDGSVLTDPTTRIKSGVVLQIGKKRFLRVL